MRATRILMWVSTGIVLLLGWTSIVGDGGLIRIRGLREQESRLVGKVSRLEADNAHLRENVRRLNEDDRYIERVARESQGLVRDGETVYRFSADRTSGASEE
jgi:cell division protein FtsB